MAWREFKARQKRFRADYGLSEYQKAARDGRPLPAEPAHLYRTCRGEYCDVELCRVYKEGYEDGYDTARDIFQG